MKKQLQKAIDLAASTGDKIIVVDEKTDKGMVIMSLNDYERLIFSENKQRDEVKNLTEEELLDKINKDIVLWKNTVEDKEEKPEEEIEETEAEAEEAVEVPVYTPTVTEEEKDEADENENLYYYEEPSKAPEAEVRKEEENSVGDFSSIKDELKAKKHWEIPSTVKKDAEEVITKEEITF